MKLYDFSSLVFTNVFTHYRMTVTRKSSSFTVVFTYVCTHFFHFKLFISFLQETIQYILIIPDGELPSQKDNELLD